MAGFGAVIDVLDAPEATDQDLRKKQHKTKKQTTTKAPFLTSFRHFLVNFSPARGLAMIDTPLRARVFWSDMAETATELGFFFFFFFLFVCFCFFLICAQRVYVAYMKKRRALAIQKLRKRLCLANSGQICPFPRQPTPAAASHCCACVLVLCPSPSFQCDWCVLRWLSRRASFFCSTHFAFFCSVFFSISILAPRFCFASCLFHTFIMSLMDISWADIDCGDEDANEIVDRALEEWEHNTEKVLSILLRFFSLPFFVCLFF